MNAKYGIPELLIITICCITPGLITYAIIRLLKKKKEKPPSNILDN